MSRATPRPNVSRPWTGEDDDVLRRMLEEGRQFGEIADRLGRSWGGVSARTRGLRLDPGAVAASRAAARAAARTPARQAAAE